LAHILSPTREITLEKPAVSVLFSLALATVSIFLIIVYSPLLSVICLGFLSFVIIFSGYNEFVLYLSGLTSAFGITFIYREFRNTDYSGMMKYLTLIAFAFTLGITVNALTFSFETVNQLLLPHGVKLTLFYLPFLIFLKEFANYGANDLKDKLHWTDILLIIVLIAFAVYYIMRTGNDSVVLNFERKLRDWLEVLFGVRPRFKEIVGIPALYLYFTGKHKLFGRYSFLIPVLGTVGLCSIVNSFQHIQSPIVTVILREFIGVGVGTLIGFVIGIILHKSDDMIRDVE